MLLKNWLGRHGWFLISILLLATTPAQCMTRQEIEHLQKQTVDLFYHGFDAYMQHAFPEDELKPLACSPLTRDPLNPGHIEVNDVLGNYSLTLIDSLSTLAILASAKDVVLDGRKPLQDFQDGVASLVELYGDGSNGKKGTGSRSRGFDLDSKVQVFETTIRGVGGLLSAHLFAAGHLPIHGYDGPQTSWSNGFVYNGQLLRLARDLANRLLPAFHTATGLPYPRVNLRHGVPFYTNSPLNRDKTDEAGTCGTTEPEQEITETCSAGAGSLVLEFTLLSRLTGDGKYERYAKKAFQSVWDRRTDLGLIGAGIDAETGNWLAPFTGIGAGIDSFFEYAVKSHILLSSDKIVPRDRRQNSTNPDFYGIWLDAHSSIKHHLYRGSSFQHPHYIQGDIFTGATRAFWIDSLSAYYPGLLALTGDLDEAIASHLLYVALWTRYSALPERWNAATGAIDSGLRWWPGRPEFIESNWYIYQATKDPWYLHVAEMVLRDVNKRCRVECGWAGLEDVRNGELKDRMESFFLGETAKYLFLTFDTEHPLNSWDAPWVFTTEGHPMVIPREAANNSVSYYGPIGPPQTAHVAAPTCPLPPKLSPFSVSPTVLRDDYFHASSLARLHFVDRSDGANNTAESSQDDSNISSRDDTSPSNHLFYPWTLPTEYVPINGTCSRMDRTSTFDLSFPTIQNAIAGQLSLRRVPGGISIGSVSGLKIGMMREKAMAVVDDNSIHPIFTEVEVYRIYSVATIFLGRDEKIFVAPEVIADLNPVDPYFTRHRDAAAMSIVIDVDETLMAAPQTVNADPSVAPAVFMDGSSTGQGLLQQLTNMLQDKMPLDALLNGAASFGTSVVQQQKPLVTKDALLAVGPGSAPLPDIPDVSANAAFSSLPWTKIYVADENCQGVLPAEVPRQHQVLVIKRGVCTFSEKIQNIPSFPPSANSLQLVLIVNYEDGSDNPDTALLRPLLDRKQETPAGIARPNPISVVMIDGGEETYSMLQRARGIGVRRRYRYSSQGLQISNLEVV